MVQTSHEIIEMIEKDPQAESPSNAPHH
jgi:hypothetical protein